MYLLQLSALFSASILFPFAIFYSGHSACLSPSLSTFFSATAAGITLYLPIWLDQYFQQVPILHISHLFSLLTYLVIIDFLLLSLSSVQNFKCPVVSGSISISDCLVTSFHCYKNKSEYSQSLDPFILLPRVRSIALRRSFLLF